jgi:glycosyltransferase involved in cell wall biosynthesis
VIEFSTNPLQAVRTLRRVVRELKPDVVHAHSSLAGLLVRTSLRNRHPVPLLFTPHGYAFERLDVGRVTRAAYRVAEWLLSWNTEMVVACSRRELSLSRHWHTRRGSVLVPNVAPVDVQAAFRRDTSGRSRTWTVVGVGRLAPAKDPEFFLAVVEELERRGLPVDAVWIGDGSSDQRKRLEEHGVVVTGWKPRRLALDLLASADAYVHASAWDSAPMTLLEVSALGVPAIARRSRSMIDLPESVSDGSAAGLATRLACLLRDGEPARDANLATWRNFFADNNTRELRRTLVEAYMRCTKDPGHDFDVTERKPPRWRGAGGFPLQTGRRARD